MAEQKPISGIKACVFDAYGTLFDVHSAVGKHRRRLGDLADPVSLLWRTKQLEYTCLRSLMGRHADFRQVTRDALDVAFDMHDVTDPDLRKDLIDAYLHLDCYPEVPEALTTLKSRGFKIAILSNGTPAMLEAAVSHSALDDAIEHIFSVETVGIFKPAPQVYQIAVDGLNVAPEEIVFQSPPTPGMPPEHLPLVSKWPGSIDLDKVRSGSREGRMSRFINLPSCPIC